MDKSISTAEWGERYRIRTYLIIIKCIFPSESGKGSAITVFGNKLLPMEILLEFFIQSFRIIFTHFLVLFNCMYLLLQLNKSPLKSVFVLNHKYTMAALIYF